MKSKSKSIVYTIFNREIKENVRDGTIFYKGVGIAEMLDRATNKYIHRLIGQGGLQASSLEKALELIDSMELA